MFFLRILITLSRPALMTVPILAFVTIWNAYPLALLVFTTALAVHAAAGLATFARAAAYRQRPVRSVRLDQGLTGPRGRRGRPHGPDHREETPVLADLPLHELRQYQPEIAEPADFAEFWASEIRTARAGRSEPAFTPASSPAQHAAVFDVTFGGYAGDPIKAWLLVPHRAGPGAAVIVQYVGYGGGRGDPFDWLAWTCAGHPHLIMDCRGQGGSWRSADTSDPGGDGAPSAAGFLTRGIGAPGSHYYTRLFIDAARAVDAARAHPAAAGRPVVTTGASQGGGLAIAAAHLAGDVAAALPDVPFLAHPRRALEVTDAQPYRELAEFCRVNPDRAERAFATLAYLDVVNHGRHAQAPALFSVGLADDVTPASTVFAAFNNYAGPKEIAVYPYSGHEGGGTRHFLAQLAFLRQAGLG
jgi:cephalosporin-C deacetylase